MNGHDRDPCDYGHGHAQGGHDHDDGVHVHGGHDYDYVHDRGECPGDYGNAHDDHDYVYVRDHDQVCFYLFPFRPGLLSSHGHRVVRIRKLSTYFFKLQLTILHEVLFRLKVLSYRIGMRDIHRNSYLSQTPSRNPGI